MNILKKYALIIFFVLLSFEANSQSLDEGQKLFDAKDYDRAILILRPFAEMGEAQAQYLLGRMYTRGLGINEDQRVAIEWLEAAAAQNHTRSMILLSLTYAFGTPKNFSRAIQLLREAAALGDADAMFNLARFYEMGTGVERDRQEALRWFIQAAEHGQQNAQKEIERYRERGIVLAGDEHPNSRPVNVTPERFRMEFRRQARRLCNEIGARVHAYRTWPTSNGCVLSGPTTYSDVNLELYFLSASCAPKIGGGTATTTCTGEVSYDCRNAPSTSRGANMVGQICRRMNALRLVLLLDLAQDGRSVSFNIRVN